MITKKEKFSMLKRKIQERVKRATEPFKGTLLNKRCFSTFKVEEESNQTPEQERESIGEKTLSLEKKLRERIESSDKPFYGCIGSHTK